MTCKVCNKSFNRKDNLKRHTLTHNNEAPLKCDICNRAYIRIDTLKRHFVDKHKSEYYAVIKEAEAKKQIE